MKYTLKPTQQNVVIEHVEEKQGGIILPSSYNKEEWVRGNVISIGDLVPEKFNNTQILFKKEMAHEFDGKYISDFRAVILL